MTEADVDTVLGWLAEGGSVRVPFNAPLFSDNYPVSSTLRGGASGRYALETLFKEPQTVCESEPVQECGQELDEGALRAKLRKAAFAECIRA